MDFQLKGKRALISGGSRGLGKAIARTLLDEGARVVVAARHAETVEQAAADLAAATGGEAHGLTVDTRDDISVNTLVEKAVSILGGLDIVVNAAGKPGAAPATPGVAGLSSEFIVDEFNVKLVGYLRVARAAAPHLKASGWGRIISIGGLAARQCVGITGSVRSVAVSALTKNLADELAPFGINVTAVHPGGTRTEGSAEFFRERAAAQGIEVEALENQFAAGSLLGRLVEADEVAAVVAFLASPKSAAINGDTIPVGGGVPRAIHY